MQSTTALWAALTLTAIAFAGCIGGGGELDMLVTPSDDPVTEPFHFEATGPKYDVYTWDFNDGTVMEGAEVDHLFGFTNGKVVVRLTAQNEGEEPVAVLREVDLGGSDNVPVDGVLTTSTFWIDPSESFSVSAAESSDPDGDPLLYKWTCQRVADLNPVDTSHPPHEGFGGVPFGVDAWAVKANVTADQDLGSDFCSTLDPTKPQAWSLEMDSLSGTMTESGVYEIELFVRDPKSPPHVSRLGLYVSEPDRLKPNLTQTEAITGTFLGGGGGQFQGIYDNGFEVEELGAGTPAPSEAGGEQNFDLLQHAFSVDMHSLEGEITFSYSCGDGECGETTAQYRLYVEGSSQNTISETSQASRTIGKDDIKAKASGFPQDYILEIQIVPAGAQVSVDFDMTFTKDIDPLNWYELPPA